ncbi:MAG: DUF3285 domain-containing protein [Cyanobacteria bacterium SBLK]|nr:DUF3285 domain-containing protein [Cyanobacteria bacterium SBLK]
MTSSPTPDNSISESPLPETADSPTTETPTPAEPPPSYVKLAMRNMVRKRGKSLFHFFLSTVGVLALLIGISYLTR